MILKGFKSFRRDFADRTGLEPATSAVTGQHSNQLNYRSFYLMYLRFYCECRIPTHQSPFFHPGDGKDICFFIEKSSLIAQNEENNEENQFQP